MSLSLGVMLWYHVGVGHHVSSKLLLFTFYPFFIIEIIATGLLLQISTEVRLYLFST